MLAHHLNQPPLGVRGEGLALGDRVDDGDLLPHEQAQAVGLGEHGLVLRVVGQPEEVEAGLLHDLYVAPVLIVGDCVAEPGHVLMAVRAVELAADAVEHEPVAVGGDPAEAERVRDRVLVVARGDARLDAVDGGRLGRVERRVGDRLAPRLDLDRLPRPHRGGPLPRRHDATGRVAERVRHRRLDRRGAVVDHLGARADARVALGQPRRVQADARRAVRRAQVDRVGLDEPHVAVEAAVEREVGIERRDVGVVPVVDAHRHHVVAGADGVGHVERERGVAAHVAADGLPVHPDLGDLIGALDVEELATRGCARPANGIADLGPEAEGATVPADPSAVAGDVVEGILGVPGVREVDPPPRPVVECGRLGAGRVVVPEAPAIVDRDLRPLRERGHGETRKEESRHHAQAGQGRIAIRPYGCRRQCGRPGSHQSYTSRSPAFQFPRRIGTRMASSAERRS